ncbi:nucleic acid-binding protein [Leucogyrophana mollusca]|uniref:Nucleic acid-binding protein n=1 Tax=Leucogyrophana mollusca TaxID=85980 RepID=A0ACB8BTL7_9AGAM|nr:nucleic acid-binding protein [Leucogyrophana mollusca]
MDRREPHEALYPPRAPRRCPQVRTHRRSLLLFCSSGKVYGGLCDVQQIDLGEETGPRTVVSGLVRYIPIEDMQDKYLVAICNLKPANMRGVKSFATVLAATSKVGKDAGTELIQPPPGSKPGDRVYFEGPEYENATPVSQMNPKKNFETIQPGFTTLDTKEVA